MVRSFIGFHEWGFLAFWKVDKASKEQRTCVSEALAWVDAWDAQLRHKTSPVCACSAGPRRREALRFRRAMEEAQERLSQATDDNSRLKGELEAASTELEAVDAFANTL